MSNLDSSTRWAIFAIFEGICWFILTPYCIWCTYKYYQHRNHIIIHKRYPSVTLLFCYIAIASICIEQGLFRLCWTLSEDWESHSNVSDTLIIMSYIVSAIIQMPIAWILALRYWLIYYKVQWTNSTLNKQWKIHLNYLDIKSDWYLSHKSTIGNYKYMTKRVLIACLCIIIITIITKLYDLRSDRNEINLAFGILFSIVPLITMIIIRWKMRKFVDLFYIMKEFKAIQTFIVIAIAIMFLLLGVFPEIFGWNPYIQSLVWGINGVIDVVIFISLQTIYVLKQVKFCDNGDFMRLNSNKIKNDEQRLAEMMRRNTMTADDENGGKSDGDNIRDIKKTLRSEDTFEPFMQHLSKEWSMELLLAFIEFTQLQVRIKENYQQLPIVEDMTFIGLQESVLMNDGIPRSYIVYHDNLEELMERQGINLRYELDVMGVNKMTEFKIRSYALYLKYVTKRAELQINISYAHRKVLEDYMDDIDLWIGESGVTPLEMFGVYKDVVMELSKLLGHSHYRYCGIPN